MLVGVDVLSRLTDFSCSDGVDDVQKLGVTSYEFFFLIS